jgi:hypothetical protein
MVNYHMRAHYMQPPTAPIITRAPTRQDVAIVVCGGGDPFAEMEAAKAMCIRLGKGFTFIVGNDMIEHCPEHVVHACTLHPDKLGMWLSGRLAKGYDAPDQVWAHRHYESSVTHWTRDWNGSTGLFCAKVARENGFVHVLLCGVPMTVEADHFVRHQRWNAAHGFRKGWHAHFHELRPYIRSFSGWTMEEYGAPSDEWLLSVIEDQHQSRTAIGTKA